MRVHKFKNRNDQSVHVVAAFHTRRVKRAEARTVCTLRTADMVRLAPHSDIRKEPAITCDVCVAAVTGWNDLADQPVRDWPIRKRK